MISLKELLTQKTHHGSMETPSVSIKHEDSLYTLHLKFGTKDKIIEASYEGALNIWFSSLCSLLISKDLTFTSSMNRSSWEKHFAHDQAFWDLWSERNDEVFFLPLELLRAAVDKFQGREYLYLKSSPLICRCFGVRESDISDYLKAQQSPTLADLSSKTKAGMSCRSCKPQLQRWLTILDSSQNKKRYFKNRPFADWILSIQDKLGELPKHQDWKFEVQSFKEKAVIISYDKEVSQKEEEEASRLLQAYLGAEVDSDLGFFLRRLKHL